MARRLSFGIAQTITILGFWIASILLIGLICKAASNFHAPGVQDQALTQAYYYAIFAAGIYQIISYMMCVTCWGAWRGHYSKDFKLTIAQRTLMLQTISYLVYLLLGALVYSKIEGWEYLDAVYWADFTTLTIGIGDNYTPETHLGRSLLFPFALGGIIVLGLVVGSIRSLVVDRSKKRMGNRIREKMRRRMVQRVLKANDAGNTKAAQKGVPGLDIETANTLMYDDKATEMERRRAEFEAMRSVQAMAVKQQKWISLSMSAFAFAFLVRDLPVVTSDLHTNNVQWFIGAMVFWYTEIKQQWSYFESLYFSYTTLLTIGYGDFQPISNSGRPFFVFWTLLAIPTLTILISDMGDTVVKVIKDLTIWLGEVTVLPNDESGFSDRLRYGLFKLTFGKIKFKNSGPMLDKIDSEVDEDIRRFEEMNPGLVHMYPRQEEGKHHKKRDLEAGDDLAAEFEESERQSERRARQRGDSIAEGNVLQILKA
jgi:potassium channel subfamily K, other eukaryote